MCVNVCTLYAKTAQATAGGTGLTTPYMRAGACTLNALRAVPYGFTLRMRTYRTVPRSPLPLASLPLVHYYCAALLAMCVSSPPWRFTDTVGYTKIHDLRFVPPGHNPHCLYSTNVAVAHRATLSRAPGNISVVKRPRATHVDTRGPLRGAAPSALRCPCS